MKRSLFVLLAICISTVSHAASKQEVAEALRLNRQALQYTQADEAQLDEALEHLEAARAILENGESGTGDQNACLAFAVERYRASGYTSADAMDQAGKACKSVSDMDVVKFAFEKYRASGYTSADSMDRAAQLSGPSMKGKSKLVSFIFDKYRASGYTSADAVGKAAGLATSLSRNSQNCLEVAFSNYRSSGYTSADAIEKAATACRR